MEKNNIEISAVIPALRESLSISVDNIVSDYAEIAVDAIFEDGLLRDIPIVRTFAALCKVGYSLHERNLLKQTIAFINGFNERNLTQEEIDNYNDRIDNNPKREAQELERILLILNNNIDIKRSIVLGRFYYAYRKSAIEWEKFCELSEANRRMFVEDYSLLEK